MTELPTGRTARMVGRAIGSGWRIGLSLWLAPAAGAAQTSPASPAPAPANIVRVGDGTMNGARIQPYDNLWLVTVRRIDGSVDERGLSSDHVRFRYIEGRRYLTRVEGTTAIVGAAGQFPASRFSMTFNIFDPISMVPLRGESRESDGSVTIREFNGTHIVTRTTPATGAEAVRTEFSIADPAFDFHGGMTGLLLAALPLGAGYAASIPGVGETGDDLTPIQVVREEVVAAGHLGRVRAWVVRIGNEPLPTLYWISRRSPYVIKVVVRAAGGSISWEML
jgi:hypothetical protein